MQRARLPPFYRRGQSKSQPNVQRQQQRQPLVQVHNDLYAKLLNFLGDKYNQRITRRANTLYTVNDFRPVAEIRSPQIVSIYLEDSASGKFDAKIEELEIPDPINVPREFYGYLRRHITKVAGGETWRRRNKFYAEDGTLVAELLSSEKVRIHVQVRTGLFSKTTTTEINIADLKPAKIYIPRELLYITKKLFGSYRQFDRGVRMDSSKKSSLVESLGLPDCAKIFFGKATAGLTKEEVKYLILNWASDLKNTRKARTNTFSNGHQPKMIYLAALPRSAPTSLLIESAEISIDEESLSSEERLEVMHRLGLQHEGQEEISHYHAAPRQMDWQANYDSRQPSSTAFPERELKKQRDVERALRIEETTQAAPLGEMAGGM